MHIHERSFLDQETLLFSGMPVSPVRSPAMAGRRLSGVAAFAGGYLTVLSPPVDAVLDSAAAPLWTSTLTRMPPTPIHPSRGSESVPRAEAKPILINGSRIEKKATVTAEA